MSCPCRKTRDNWPSEDCHFGATARANRLVGGGDGIVRSRRPRKTDAAWPPLAAMDHLARCVGFTTGGLAVGWRWPRWRCNSSSRSGMSISTAFIVPTLLWQSSGSAAQASQLPRAAARQRRGRRLLRDLRHDLSGRELFPAAGAATAGAVCFSTGRAFRSRRGRFHRAAARAISITRSAARLTGCC